MGIVIWVAGIGVNLTEVFADAEGQFRGGCGFNIDHHTILRGCVGDAVARGASGYTRAGDNQ